MSTGQKYSGKGETTTLPEQTVKNKLQAALSEDRQPTSFINSRVFQAQTNLIVLTDQFVASGFEQGPIQAIANLLHYWLASPVEELSAQDNTHQLHRILLLTDFFSEFYLSIKTYGVEGQSHV